MPRPYPREFRDDVVRVARNREDGVTIEQIAADFGIHPMTLSKWMRQADVDDGAPSWPNSMTNGPNRGATSESRFSANPVPTTHLQQNRRTPRRH